MVKRLKLGKIRGASILKITDFLLIYKIENEVLILERVGTHKDLFQQPIL